MSKSRLIEVNKYNMPLFMKKDEEEKVFDAFPSQPDKDKKENPRRKKGVLYTANKYNMKLFEPEKDENIYDGRHSGSNLMQINPNPGPFMNIGQSSVSQRDLTFGQSSPMGNTAGNLSAGTKSIPSGGIGGVQTSGLANTSLIDSNKFGGSNFNFDASNGLSGAALKGLNDANVQQAAFNGFNMGQSGGIGGGMGDNAGWIGVAKAVARTAGEVADRPMEVGNDTFKHGAWDYLDPIYQATRSNVGTVLESDVGDALQTTGVNMTKNSLSSGNWQEAAAGAALKITGDMYNWLFGMGVDKERLKGINEGINRNRNFVSNAESFDDIKDPVASMGYKRVYTGGFFSDNKAIRKNRELRRQYSDALTWADNSVRNNIVNISKGQLGNALASYSAFGGPIIRKRKKI